jgi:WD40 repeat protein
VILRRVCVFAGWFTVDVVAISPDGSWLTTGSRDRTVRIWDLATGSQRHTLTGHTADVTAVAIAADGHWLATAGADHTVPIWDPAAGAGVASSRVSGSLVHMDWTE